LAPSKINLMGSVLLRRAAKEERSPDGAPNPFSDAARRATGRARSDALTQFS